MLILLLVLVLAAPAAAAVPDVPADPIPVPSVLPSVLPSPSPSVSLPPVAVDPAPGLIDRLLGQVTLGVRDGMRAWWDEQIERARERSARRVEESLRNAELLLRTPDVRDQERVRQLEGMGRFVAGGLLAVLLAMGLSMLWAGERLLAAKELLPRVFMASAAVVLGGTVMTTGTNLANALLAGFLGGDSGVLSASASRILLAEGLGWALLPLLYVVLGYVMFGLGILRVAILTVLAASGPLVQAGWALPQLDAWARTWWRMLAALLLAPVGQAFVLKLASWVFFSGGEFGWSGAFADAVVLGVLMALMAAIPLIAFKIALGPAFAGMGRVARAARKSATLAAA